MRDTLRLCLRMNALTSADSGDIVIQNDPICVPRPTFAEALPPVQAVHVQ
jgi:hypothetical protein